MTMQILANPFLAWMLTWLIHSTVLLGAVWLFELSRPLAAPRLREHLWRVAIVASLISASVATNESGIYSPKRFEIAQVQSSPALFETSWTESAAAQPPADQLIAVDQPATASQVSAVGARGGFARIFRPSPAWLIGAWAIAAAFLFVRLYYTFRKAIIFLGKRTSIARDDRAYLLLERLVERAGQGRLPRLSTSSSVQSPISLPGNEICLPTWALRDMAEPQLEGILAHELAHCLRRDPLYLLLFDGLRRLLFVQPLMHIGARRLAELVELAADEKAVEITGNQRAIAESLAECAGRLRSGEPSWGVAMAQHSSCFVRRIRRLLHPERYTTGGPSWYTRIATAVTALLVALSLPAFVVAARHDGGRSTSSTIITDDGGRISKIDLMIEDGDYSLKVKGSGDFSLNDSETDLETMAPGATLLIEENHGAVRTIIFESTGDEIDRTYRVDGRAAELDDHAYEWLGDILPRLMRETGINAEERAERLHRSGGADRVLEEIALIRGDYTARIYASWLVTSDDLNDRQYTDLLNRVAEIQGDYDCRIVLVNIAEHETLDEKRLVQLLEVAETIESDYDMRMALEAILAQSQNLSSGLPALIALAAREIGSDHDLSVLLQSLATGIEADSEAALAYIGATLEIGSDYERREALTAFAEHVDQNTSSWPDAIKAAATISGDHDRAEALVSIAGRMPATEENLQIYRRVSETLRGHEKRRALAAMNRERS